MVVIGLLLTSVAAYLAGATRTGDGGEPAAAAAPTTTVVSIDSSTDQVPTDEGAVAAARQSVEIPDGHHGVVITLPFTAAGGGYVGAGAKVDVYAVEPGSPATPVVVAATVLDVSVEVAPRITTGTPERPSAGHITYLLAVPSPQAPDVITAVQTKSIYVALPADGEGIDAATEGEPPEQVERGVG